MGAVRAGRRLPAAVHGAGPPLPLSGPFRAAAFIGPSRGGRPRGGPGPAGVRSGPARWVCAAGGAAAASGVSVVRQPAERCVPPPAQRHPPSPFYFSFFSHVFPLLFFLLLNLFFFFPIFSFFSFFPFCYFFLFSFFLFFSLLFFSLPPPRAEAQCPAMLPTYGQGNLLMVFSGFSCLTCKCSEGVTQQTLPCQELVYLTWARGSRELQHCRYLSQHYALPSCLTSERQEIRPQQSSWKAGRRFKVGFLKHLPFQATEKQTGVCYVGFPCEVDIVSPVKLGLLQVAAKGCYLMEQK